MNHTPRRLLPALLRAPLCCALMGILAACGGGGGGNVRSDPPPQQPPPPPPPPPPSGATGLQVCLPPVTANCIISPPPTFTFDENYIAGTRDSDFALVIRGAPGTYLTLYDVQRFRGGTRIEGGTLIVHEALVSNVEVLAAGELWLRWLLQGNLVNAGRVVVGQTRLSPNNWQAESTSTINGDFVNRGGTLSVTLGATLPVQGQAVLEGGTLELRAGQAGAYALPDAPSRQTILIAENGVSGQFDRWTAPGLFVEGTLGYTTNSVIFDVRRLSAQSAIAASGPVDAATLDSAAHLDRAFGSADRYARNPASELSDIQRRFLASAASIQYTETRAQALATLDSLTGHAHARAGAQLLEAPARASQRLATRLDRNAPGHGGAWSDLDTAGRAIVAGQEQWLDTGLLVGARVHDGSDATWFDRQGGVARVRAPGAGVYLRRHIGNGRYLDAGASMGRADLEVERPIDLGAAGRHAARSRYAVDVAELHAEAGRAYSFGRGRLTPFVALGYTTLRSDGFTEQGVTGFELVAAPAREARATLGVGARFGQDWQWRGQGIGVDAHLRYDRPVWRQTRPHLAAFEGTPDSVFAIGDPWPERGHGAFGFGVQGTGRHAAWFLALDRRFGGRGADTVWSIGWSRGL